MTHQKIEIPLSKKKISLIFIGSIAFVVTGVWFVIKRPTSLLFSSSILVVVVGIAAIVFFGATAIYSVIKLGDNTLGLIIDQSGITDNSSGVSAGFIPWEDIVGVKTVIIYNQSMIGIEVSNPDQYISRQKSFLKRKAMEANYKSYDSPIFISANGLKCNFNELCSLITNEYANHRHKTI